jgi:hypothetical protein
MLDDDTTKGQDLVEVILSIGRLGRTGILTIQTETEIIGISFHEGEMVSADALNQAQEDGFGEVLVELGKVSREDYASLVAEYQAGGGRVMDLLTERNHLDRTELLSALSHYGYRLCREALSWENYEYKFYQGQEVSFEEGLAPLPVEELLVRIADDLAPGGPLPGEMPTSDTVLVRRDPDEVMMGRDELLMGLATREGQATTRLLESMDGRRTTEDLAEIVGISLYEARLALYLLVRTGQAKVSNVVEPAKGFAERLKRRKTEEVEEESGPVEEQAVSEPQAWAASTESWTDRLSVSVSDWLPWFPRVLGMALALALILVCLAEPNRVLLPFPWQEGLHQAVQDEQISAAYLKIDRAAGTSFLLDGHFPEALGQLVEDGYLEPVDLVDPSGRELGYAAQVAGYLIYPLDDGEPAPGASRTETITGNFLLDPEFLPTRKIEADPLVLLD